MTVKQQLIAGIKQIDNPLALVQLFEMMQLMREMVRITPAPQTNHNAIKILEKFSGCLNDVDANEMKSIIHQEFNQIEGAW